MVEERIVEHTDESGTVVDRTVERTRSTPSSGMGLVLGLLLAGVFVVCTFYFLTDNSETKKDAAISKAASDVGDAATKVGNSAERAIDKLR